VLHIFKQRVWVGMKRINVTYYVPLLSFILRNL
jgi:hypothetical protein